MRTKHSFQEQFAAIPDLTAAAPGRVNLLGGHIDYHGGTVFPLAIDRYTVVCGRRTEASKATIVSMASDPTGDNVLSRIEIDLGRPIAEELASAQSEEGASHLCGVLSGFQQSLNVEADANGFEACICSNVPIGGGLSSSAALQVAFATWLQSFTGQNTSPKNLALLCQHAENEFAGVPCGAMDQMSAVFGRAGQLTKIDCHDLQVSFLPWSKVLAVLLVDSGIRHHLADGNYSQSKRASEKALEKLNSKSYRNIALKDVERHRKELTAEELASATHVVNEMQRCRIFESAFKCNDWNAAGEQLFCSHQSLRDNYRVSCSELDAIVDIARSIGSRSGCYGARMTGGGFGGYVVAMVAADKAEAIRDKLVAVGRTSPNFVASDLPSLITIPSRGAAVIG